MESQWEPKNYLLSRSNSVGSFHEVNSVYSAKDDGHDLGLMTPKVHSVHNLDSMSIASSEDYQKNHNMKFELDAHSDAGSGIFKP